MKQFIQQIVSKLVSDPTHASRGVLASFLIIGLSAATLNLGTINADLFGARLLAPLTVEDIDVQKQLENQSELQTVISDCQTNRAEGKAEELLTAFEDSFRGVLPGAGKLLLAEPATVQERKTKFIYEVITKYGELKYCLNKNRFIKSYGKEYQNDFSIDLDAYMKTRAQEEGAEPGKPIFIGMIKDEYAVVEKDMRETHAYITDIVNRAINSAIDLDQQTETRLASLANSTQLRLLAMGNALSDINNEIGNRQIVQGEVQNEYLHLQSEMLDKIADIKAYENWNKCFDDPTATICLDGKFGGNAYDQESFERYKSYTTSTFNSVQKPQSRLESSLRNFTGLAETLDDAGAEVQKAITAGAIKQAMNEAGSDQEKTTIAANATAMNGARGSISFGLLNLVNEDSRTAFLAQPFKLATIMYFAANNMVDVFVPGQEFTNYTSSIPSVGKEVYSSQICAAVDDEDTTCFSQ